MLTQKTATYGSWKSPITADLVAQSIRWWWKTIFASFDFVLI